jgi:hypothetical protein
MSKIPGVGSLFSAAAPAPSMMSARGVSAFGAPTVGAGARGLRKTAAGGVQINVTGALDPEAVARQIQRILAGHDRRVGLAA